MTKNLIKQIMLKPAEEDDRFDSKAFIETIEKGYLVDRGTKFTQKKTFSPSKIAYGEGKCPRYWYLAFEGANFEDNSNAFSVANMTSGTMSHARVLETALKNSGIAIDVEFKISYDDPKIYGICDGMAHWKDEDYVIEFKTCNNEAFEYRKKTMAAKSGHIEQLLIYMKILKKAKGVVIYENKNTHELLAIVIEINDNYIEWVDNTFNWMKTVRKHWENKELPIKPYRSNSKVCKNCPLNSDCAKAEAGVVKVPTLEELSEKV